MTPHELRIRAATLMEHQEAMLREALRLDREADRLEREQADREHQRRDLKAAREHLGRGVKEVAA